ncbi:DUF2510 domain-containing protein [Cellulomonas terrae]|uniref:DUF2510 domain-containing protein n=1 Tax=Cellulomonas terrae TaxID=311234 RepID=A0A511JQ50_9CELL|nr:DUF2510 domain-containing protein [Cellulomonas terrae]GEM00158.1 hypothetical protein CTE05_37040 [Cellulomonas terrae]
MTTPTTGNPPAGWYTDPAGSGGERWFDGAGWTEHVQTPPPPAPAVPTQFTPDPRFGPATPAAGGFGQAAPDPRFGPAAPAAGGFGQAAPDPRFGPAAPAAASTGWIQPVENHYLVNTAANLDDGKNTPARVALVVSVLAMLGVPIAGVAGIVLAVVGLKRATRLEAAGWEPKGRGRARWAMGLSIVGLVISSLLVANAVRGALADAVPTLDLRAMETEIAAGVAEQAGVTVTVQCPDTVVDGATSFQCVAVDPAGASTTVNVQVVDDAGGWTWQIG